MTGPWWLTGRVYSSLETTHVDLKATWTKIHLNLDHNPLTTNTNVNANEDSKMGAGGIIQQRVAALLPAVMHSSWYAGLTTEEKDKVECIHARVMNTYTVEDEKFLLGLLNKYADQ